MTTEKARMEALRNALGNANNRVNLIETENSKLIKENKTILADLKKSNQALAKAEEEINKKKTDADANDGLLTDIENLVKR